MIAVIGALIVICAVLGSIAMSLFNISSGMRRLDMTLQLILSEQRKKKEEK